MKRQLLLLTTAATLLLPLTSWGQYRGPSPSGDLPEPLSFPGAPDSDERGFAGLAVRVANRTQNILGVEVVTNATAFLLEVRGRVGPSVELLANLPVGSLSVSDPVFGDNSETDFGNLAAGFLLTPISRGPTRVAFGLSAGLPVADDDAASLAALLGGAIANDNNRVLFTPNLLSLRPEVRFGVDGGLVSFQSQLGLDLGFDTNNDNNLDENLSVIRAGFSLGMRPAPPLALIAELSFSDDFNNDNNNAFALLHLGGRGIFPNGGGGSIQPGLEVFFPVSEAANDLVDVGVALDLRASF